MATFYLLPPRASLENALIGLLGKLLPGLPLPSQPWDVLSDRIATESLWPRDVFLIPRDDLPEGETTADALRIGFGAEAGDRVIEVSLARDPSVVRTWILEPAEVSCIAAAR